jgi:DNA polymerase elongation subunit (family B)
MTGPRILTLDIERLPNVVDEWNLRRRGSSYTSSAQVHEYARTCCFAAKWHDKSRVEFYSEFHNGTEEMWTQAQRLLDEADIVVGYNSDNFDLPHLRTGIRLAGLPSASPFVSVDLYKVARKALKLESYKLDDVARVLGVGQKLAHEGHMLWRKVREGDSKAWARFRRYNKQDVVVTEGAFDRLLPDIKLPAVHLWDSEIPEEICRKPTCGGVRQRRGYKVTGVSLYHQYWCPKCDSWGRGGKAIARVDIRDIA